MGAHSILPPSSAGIWAAPDGCTGWVLMNQTYPEIGSREDAERGDAAHELGAQWIEDARRAKPRPALHQIAGTAASNGVIFDQEIYEGAAMYADDVMTLMRANGVFGERLHVEERIEIPGVHDLCYGTPDVWIEAHGAEIIIWDFKFGYLVVEAFENWQAMVYLAGILDKLGIDGLSDQILRIRVRIVQPRAQHRDGPIREWAFKASELRGYINIARANAQKALSGDAEFRTGPQCRNCPGRHACPAAIKAGVALYEAATLPQPLDMSIDATALQYAIIRRARQQLDALETGYKERIEAHLRGGKHVPLWRLETKYGRLNWDKPAEEVFALGDMLGVDLQKNEPVTPNQAIKSGIDESVIMAYCSKRTKGVELVPDNDSKAKRIFSHE